MGTTIHYIIGRLGRFEFWFNARFGWFFTNGMKNSGDRGGPSVRA